MKNVIIVISLLMFFVSCGKDGADGQNGVNGQSCSSVREEANKRVKITCGSDVYYVYDGAKGDKGDQGDSGLDGSDGAGCSITRDDLAGTTEITCGSTTEIVYDGQDGLNGTDGQDGVDGQDGSLVSVVRVFSHTDDKETISYISTSVVPCADANNDGKSYRKKVEHYEFFKHNLVIDGASNLLGCESIKTVSFYCKDLNTENYPTSPYATWTSQKTTYFVTNCSDVGQW